MTAQPAAHSFSVNMLNGSIKLNIKVGKYYRDFKKVFLNARPLFASFCVFCRSDICLHQQQEQNTSGSGGNGGCCYFAISW